MYLLECKFCSWLTQIGGREGEERFRLVDKPSHSVSFAPCSLLPGTFIFRMTRTTDSDWNDWFCVLGSEQAPHYQCMWTVYINILSCICTLFIFKVKLIIQEMSVLVLSGDSRRISAFTWYVSWSHVAVTCEDLGTINWGEPERAPH